MKTRKLYITLIIRSSMYLRMIVMYGMVHSPDIPGNNIILAIDLTIDGGSFCRTEILH